MAGTAVKISNKDKKPSATGGQTHHLICPVCGCTRAFATFNLAPTGEFVNDPVVYELAGKTRVCAGGTIRWSPAWHASIDILLNLRKQLVWAIENLDCVLEDRNPNLWQALNAAKKKLSCLLVRDIRAQSVLDSTGQDTLALWVIVADEAPASVWQPAQLRRIALIVEDAVFRAGFAPPLIYFRTLREQKQLDEVENGLVNASESDQQL